MKQVGHRMPTAHGLFDEEDMQGDKDADGVNDDLP